MADLAAEVVAAALPAAAGLQEEPREVSSRAFVDSRRASRAVQGAPRRCQRLRRPRPRLSVPTPGDDGAGPRRGRDALPEPARKGGRRRSRQAPRRCERSAPAPGDRRTRGQAVGPRRWRAAADRRYALDRRPMHACSGALPSARSSRIAACGYGTRVRPHGRVTRGCVPGMTLQLAHFF
jgi:hypothetical protein